MSLATTSRMMMALARLNAAPDAYRRLADAVPVVGRDALRHADSARLAPHWASWASRLRYCYTTYEHRSRQPSRTTSVAQHQWRLYRRTHRDDDSPAVVFADGTKLWYHVALVHRDNDKPAIEHANGKMEWLRYGRHHRAGPRPAVMYPSGGMEWWRDGMFVTATTSYHRPRSQSLTG